MARKHTRKPYVVVLQGVPGSGKSTYVQKFLREAATRGRQHNVVVCSTDDHFMVDGQYVYDASKIGEAHNNCFRRFLAFLDFPEDFDLIIVDNTNSTAVEIAPYMAAAAASNWPAEIHRLTCDPEVAAARNAHNVPVETVRGMASMMASERFPSWWKLVEVQA